MHMSAVDARIMWMGLKVGMPLFLTVLPIQELPTDVGNHRIFLPLTMGSLGKPNLRQAFTTIVGKIAIESSP